MLGKVEGRDTRFPWIVADFLLVYLGLNDGWGLINERQWIYSRTCDSQWSSSRFLVRLQLIASL